jgi:Family of unknown function (DUF6338)
MVQPPSTVEQFIFVVLFVLPGVTYQFLRERWRGPAPGEQDLGQRVLRAMTASIALDAVYAVAFGPWLAGLVRGSQGWTASLVGHIRVAGLWGLLLFLVVPAAGAAVVSWLENRNKSAVTRPEPTAWDYMLGKAINSRFVRARLKDGTWVGGWYGAQSYASGYPSSSDLYLQWAYQMNDDGSFGPPTPRSSGIYLRLDNIDIIEFIDRQGNAGSGEAISEQE